MEEINAQIESQAADIARLTAECASLNITIAGLCAEIATLKEQKAAAGTKVAELEGQVVEIRNGYQHKLDELRGRIRGILQGQLTRWLQTALDASHADPPWTQAIQERLEDALRLIEREMKWLQPSV
jgi:chromosome segregation ATPase